MERLRIALEPFEFGHGARGAPEGGLRNVAERRMTEVMSEAGGLDDIRVDGDRLHREVGLFVDELLGDPAPELRYLQ